MGAVVKALKRGVSDLIWKVRDIGVWPSLIIEISGACNARCRYCCRGTGNHQSTVPYMAAKTFAAVFAHLKKIGCLFN
ncbi:MAG: hypothetical protein LBD66_01380 [Holosporales bacterium]|nr:hypothetical protein [Holosporales bacterium]